MRRPRSLVPASLGTLGLLLCLGLLAWFHVLPGGWRMRSWIKPLAEWEADARAAHRAERLEVFAGENPTEPAGAVLFLGSSTIERWPLAEAFPGRDTVNRGIGNETAQDLLARIEESLPAADPGAFVLYGGSLDFRREGLAPYQTRNRVESVVVTLRERYGDEVPIAVLGILPGRKMSAPDLVRLVKTNNELKRMCGVRDVDWVSTWREPVRRPDGMLSSAASVDDLHLNESGYRAVAGWLVEDGGRAGRMLAP